MSVSTPSSIVETAAEAAVAPAGRWARRPADAGARGRLISLAGAPAQVSMANDQLLPAVPGLAGLLPGGGLRRGSTIAVSGGAGGGTSLALAVAAGPSISGSWCAAIGTPPLGIVAAAEMGIALERFPLIRAGGRTWVRAVAAALEASDVILAWPARGVSAEEARRLTALGRERGAVLVACGPGWPERTDLRLEAVRSEWIGIERGHGRLRARRIEVAIGGRGAASRERRTSLWLPSSEGRIEAASETGMMEPATIAAAAGATDDDALVAVTAG